MDWDAIKPLLDAKLDPAHIKKPSGKYGPKGDWLEGWHVINEANRIFGFGGWSYTIDLTRDVLTEGVNSRGEPQWSAAYTCVCTLTVGDVVRQDVGFGSGFAKGPGDAIEGATKEAVTDALKRALRTFGNPFGLALYDKARVNVGTDEPDNTPKQDDPPAFNPGGARDRIKASLLKARTLPALADAWKRDAETLTRIKAEKPPMFAELMAAKDARKAALTGPDQAAQAPDITDSIPY